MKTYLITFSLFLATTQAFSQYSERPVSKKEQHYIDSLKNVTYDYKLPLLGQKAYKAGFDIQYPFGIMTNYFYAKQGLIIENLQLGLKTNNQDIPLTPVDFIGFSNNTASAHSITVRPDIWILPFIDLYGVFGYGSATTTVNIVTPVTLTSVVKQNVKTAGLGVTSAFGVGPLFAVVDVNWTWNKPDKLDKPVPINNLSLRLGHTFKIPDKPYRNFGIWAGAMRLRMGSGTVGQIALSDALPPDVFKRKDEIVTEYYAWYNALSPTNPVDIKKKQVADQVLTPIIERLDAADGSAVVRYAIDKRPSEEWNMIIGGQFQLNKHWAFRSEAGIIGDRKSILISAQYRFLWF